MEIRNGGVGLGRYAWLSTSQVLVPLLSRSLSLSPFLPLCQFHIEHNRETFNIYYRTTSTGQPCEHASQCSFPGQLCIEANWPGEKWLIQICGRTHCAGEYEMWPHLELIFCICSALAYAKWCSSLKYNHELQKKKKKNGQVVRALEATNGSKPKCFVQNQSAPGSRQVGKTWHLDMAGKKDSKKNIKTLQKYIFFLIYLFFRIKYKVQLHPVSMIINQRCQFCHTPYSCPYNIHYNFITL